jgi:hypothetical protein
VTGLPEPLSAPLEVGFDYTRSLGPAHGRFATRAAPIAASSGCAGSDGRVHVPPVEYDPDTAAALDEFVPVEPHGAAQFRDAGNSTKP